MRCEVRCLLTTVCTPLHASTGIACRDEVQLAELGIEEVHIRRVDSIRKSEKVDSPGRSIDLSSEGDSDSDDSDDSDPRPLSRSVAACSAFLFSSILPLLRPKVSHVNPRCRAQEMVGFRRLASCKILDHVKLPSYTCAEF